jgi:hypothetical protein
MDVKIYTVKDLKANAFLKPCFFPSNNAFELGVAACLTDEDHNFNKYTEDFALYELGSYNDNTGKLTTLEQPLHLCSMDHIKTQYNKATNNG